MGALERRITRIEERVKGDEIELFEELMTEIHLMLEAERLGKPYTPRPLSAEVAKTLEAAIEELRADPALQHIFTDADAPGQDS